MAGTTTVRSLGTYTTEPVWHRQVSVLLTLCATIGPSLGWLRLRSVCQRFSRCCSPSPAARRSHSLVHGDHVSRRLCGLCHPAVLLTRGIPHEGQVRYLSPYATQRSTSEISTGAAFPMSTRDVITIRLASLG